MQLRTGNIEKFKNYKKWAKAASILHQDTFSPS
jgi:hypothetical protein